MKQVNVNTFASLSFGIIVICSFAQGDIKQATAKVAAQSDGVEAVLEAIAFAEGTSGDKGYFTQFTGTQFNDTSNHPGEMRCSGSLCSDAAGKYQFLSTTWEEVRSRLNLPDFSPDSQRKAAIQLLKDNDAYELAKAGKTDEALYKVCAVWASLPCHEGDTIGAYNQSVKPISEILESINSTPPEDESTEVDNRGSGR